MKATIEVRDWPKFRIFSTDIAPIKLAEPHNPTTRVKTRLREKSKAKAAWKEFVTVLHPRRKARYGVINASEKHAVMAAARTSGRRDPLARGSLDR
jgi:hypothetical protein